MQLNSSLFKSYKFWLTSTVVLYFVTTLLVLPYVVKSQTIGFFQKELQHQATVEKVTFNPFTFDLKMLNFELFDKQNKSLVAFTNLRIDFDLLNSIFTQIAQFNNLELHDLKVNIKLLKDGKLNLLALVPKQKEEVKKEKDADEKSEVFPINFNQIKINNTQIAFSDYTLDEVLNINITPFNLNMSNLNTLLENKASYSLDFGINKHSNFISSGDVTLNPIKVNGNINLSQLHLGDFWPKVQKQFNFNINDTLVDFNTQYKVSLLNDDLKFNLEKTKLAVSDFSLSSKKSTKDVIALKNLELNLSSFDLISQDIQIENILLSELYADFVINKDKSNNLSTLFVQKETNNKTTKMETQETKEDVLPWNVEVKQVSLKNSKVLFSDHTITTPFSTSIHSLDVNINDINLKENSIFTYNINAKIDKTAKINSTGKLSIKPLEIHSDYNLEKLALNIFQPYLNETLNINLVSADFNTKGKFDLEKNTNQVTLNTDTSINNINVKQKNSDESLLKVSNLNINKLTFSQAKNSVKIESINLIKPYAKIHIDENKKTNFANVVKESPKPKMEVKKETKEEFTFELGPIDVQDGSMNFTDLSLPLPFNSFIESLKGNISELSSFSSKPSSINLEGVIDEYGLAKIDGSLNYKKIEENTKINMLFKNLATKNLTPYSSEFIGRKIDDGKLTLDLQYKIVDSILSAHNKIIINKIKLGDEIKSENSVSVPIDLAIALLEDSDGVIDLSLPITGDINDPEFHIGSIVGQALTNLIVKAVTSPFTFLGSLLGSETDDLKYLEFEAGNAILLPPAKEKLDTLAKAFEKRPNLALELEKPYNRFIDFKQMQIAKFETLLNKTIENIKKENKDEKIDSYLLALESMYIKTSSPEALFTLKKTFLKEIKITELSSEERLPAVSSNKDATQDESIKDASKEEVTLVKEIFEKVKYLNHLKQTHIKAQTVSDKEMQTLASLRANTISAYLESVHKVNKEAIVIKDFKVFINKDETKWIKTEMGITVKQK